MYVLGTDGVAPCEDAPTEARRSVQLLGEICGVQNKPLPLLIGP